MKISLYSDLHGEFEAIPHYPNPGSDILILAGDTYPVDYLMRGENSPYHTKENFNFYEFMNHVSKNWKYVIMIAGNHEYYSGDINNSFNDLKVKLAHMSNVILLDNESIIIDGVKFIGTTLWTDMNKNDPHTVWVVKSQMNDYRLIYDHGYKFTPQKEIILHDIAKAFIVKEASEFDGLCVVIGHHAPSKLSTHPRYKDDILLNGAYSSDLSNIMFDHPNIKYWLHGHCHDTFGYYIGNTYIKCNPKGYMNENSKFDPALILDLDNFPS